MPSLPPTAEFQLDFLKKVEVLLARGRFTSTYKFALLIALTNIAVEQGNDSGDELDVEIDEIARQFVKIYANMARPYRDGRVLKQLNAPAQQAEMLTHLQRHVRVAEANHRRLCIYSVNAEELLPSARRTVKRYVLDALQTTGGSNLTAAPNHFMFVPPRAAKPGSSRSSIRLQPQVMACLRCLHDIIVTLTQAHWARWVRERNKSLGADRRLEAFLFGENRTAVRVYAERFYDLQDKRCFYSGKKLDGPKSGEVDHFIPWARYPFDSPFNLVLASRAENNKKSDQLASPEARARWLARNANAETCALLTQPAPTGFGAAIADRDTSRMIAQWAYRAP